MRLGIFGGTFDPPHVGHLILAAESFEQLHLDRLLWVLTAQPPHKLDQSITPLDLRFELVKCAIEDNPKFEISRIEIDRPGPHFAYETVQLLAGQYPGAELFYIIGGDSLRDLPTWRDPQKLISSITALGVMRRPRTRIDLSWLDEQIPGLSKKILFINTPQLDISSSQVRKRAADGKTYRYFLPEAVYQLVVSNHLYR